MIRLCDGPAEYDFRIGRQGWGHALHSSTWKPVPGKWIGHLWWRRRTPDQVSVLAHMAPPPRPGDTIIFSAKSGLERRARIVTATSLGNPRDMYELLLEEAPTPEPGPPVLSASAAASYNPTDQLGVTTGGER